MATFKTQEQQKTATELFAQGISFRDQCLSIAAKVLTYSDDKGFRNIDRIRLLVNADSREIAELQYRGILATVKETDKELFAPLYELSLKYISDYKSGIDQCGIGSVVSFNKNTSLHKYCSIAKEQGTKVCCKVFYFCSLIPMRKIGGIVEHNRRSGELVKMMIALFLRDSSFSSMNREQGNS